MSSTSRIEVKVEGLDSVEKVQNGKWHTMELYNTVLFTLLATRFDFLAQSHCFEKSLIKVMMTL